MRCSFKVIKRFKRHWIYILVIRPPSLFLYLYHRCHSLFALHLTIFFCFCLLSLSVSLCSFSSFLYLNQPLHSKTSFLFCQSPRQLVRTWWMAKQCLLWVEQQKVCSCGTKFYVNPCRTPRWIPPHILNTWAHFLPSQHFSRALRCTVTFAHRTQNSDLSSRLFALGDCRLFFDCHSVWLELTFHGLWCKLWVVDFLRFPPQF